MAYVGVLHTALFDTKNTSGVKKPFWMSFLVVSVQLGAVYAGSWYALICLAWLIAHPLSCPVLYCLMCRSLAAEMIYWDSDILKGSCWLWVCTIVGY